MNKLMNENGVNIKCEGGCTGCGSCSIKLSGDNTRDEESARGKGSLYAAEALIYYFYFFPATNRA